MIKTSIKVISLHAASASFSGAMELVCAVSNLADLCAAVEHGADCIRIEYGNAHHTACSLTNFSFGRAGLEKGIQYARDAGCKTVLNFGATISHGDWEHTRDLIERAAYAGIDAITFADTALMLYCLAQYPDLPLQYAIPEEGFSRETIRSFRKRFGISRFLLPRTVSLPQLEQLSAGKRTELEVRAFGRLCSITERRKLDLSDSATSYDVDAVERCASLETASNDSYYATNGCTDANALWLLPKLLASGVQAIQVEAPSLGAIQTAHVMQVWREALDNCLKDPARFSVKPSWLAGLGNFAPACSIICRTHGADGLKVS